MAVPGSNSPPTAPLSLGATIAPSRGPPPYWSKAVLREETLQAIAKTNKAYSHEIREMVEEIVQSRVNGVGSAAEGGTTVVLKQYSDEELGRWFRTYFASWAVAGVGETRKLVAIDTAVRLEVKRIS